MTRLSIIAFAAGLFFFLWLNGNGASSGSLYRCVTDSAGTIYTDNPAQLEQCAPITANGAVTSLATGASSGPPIGTPSEQVPMVQPPLEPPLLLPPPEGSDQTIAEIPQNAASNSPPCPAAVNPLNPLSAPPCPTGEAVPPAVNGMPPDPTVLPAVSPQP